MAHLEPEHAIPAVQERWLTVGLSTARIAQDEARDAVLRLYQAAGYPLPNLVLVAQSPLQALLMRRLLLPLPRRRSKRRKLLQNAIVRDTAAKLTSVLDDRGLACESYMPFVSGNIGYPVDLRSRLRDALGSQLPGEAANQLRNYSWNRLTGTLAGALWRCGENALASHLSRQGLARLLQVMEPIGSWDGYWLAYYEAAQLIGTRPTRELSEFFAAYCNYARSCGIGFFYQNAAFVCDRPLRIALDESWRLHSGIGRALEWSDGFGLYAWHGHDLPQSHEFYVTESHRIDAGVIDSEPNAELRRIGLEIFGFGRYLADRKAEVVSEDTLHGQPRRLLACQVVEETIRILEIINGTEEPDGSRRKYHLGAMPGETPHECVAASFGRPSRKYREVLGT